MKLKYLSFEQPIGEFAMTVMPVVDILSICDINRRTFDVDSLTSHGGPQREASTGRINEISKYSETPDATFPTPILLALPEGTYTIDDNYIELKDNKIVASVVDGQHRLLGLEKSKYKKDFSLPVVFILDATSEQQALIFTIINGKQTKVSASIIYDLFDVVVGRSPFKTAHEIARAMNQDINSPFHRRLKMLGKKMEGTNESLSQGTFVTQLVKLISSNPNEDYTKLRTNQQLISRPNCIFNQYFMDDKDEVILKILNNLFRAFKENFEIEWNNPIAYNLSKTTGYTGIIKALPKLYEKGNELRDLSFCFFDKIVKRLKFDMVENELQFTSQSFPPNSIGENILKDKIILALNNTEFDETVVKS